MMIKSSLLLSLLLLVAVGDNVAHGFVPSSKPAFATTTTTTTTHLNLWNFFGNNKKQEEKDDTELWQEEVSCCVIGGGVSGLIAASKVGGGGGGSTLLLEADTTLGGRVQSDVTEDGYVLDRGFAVFIEEYPVVKALLNYTELGLKQFLPGALVKTDIVDDLSRVADPLRVPGDLFVALTAPVGSLADKFKVLRLLSTVLTKTTEELFAEPETDTLTCLKERYGFSDEFISQFYEPFLEGIYLAPLNQQSSRMFHFVFQMFSKGAAALPAGGMGAVAEQLTKQAKDAGVSFKMCTAVESIEKGEDGFVIATENGGTVRAESVVLATSSGVTQKLLSTVVDDFEKAASQVEQKVGCFYYGFDTEVPVKDPILVLNGIRGKSEALPVNNICFPSVVNPSYAPEGCNLCSVTILNDVVNTADEAELDEKVRKQLAGWFPQQADDILNKWKLLGSYYIDNAQPGQLGGPSPANINGGRDATMYREKKLPEGLVLCGDHMATATLNGAMESGINAANAILKLQQQPNEAAAAAATLSS
mmetsp:Transcript_30774/g.47148  ORF Transcript_30774/g.47148 Transcript_30774/m.47148 type:complete len:533 (-) Transcript_30774:469-2067(-)